MRIGCLPLRVQTITKIRFNSKYELQKITFVKYEHMEPNFVQTVRVEICPGFRLKTAITLSHYDEMQGQQK